MRKFLGLVTSSILFYLAVVAPVLAEAPSWSCNGPYGGRIRALALSPDYAVDHLVFAGADKAGLFRSADAGDTWQGSIGLPVNLTVSSIVISPAFNRDRTLFISTIEGGVFKSWDAGVSWSPWIGGLSTLSIAQLAISPAYATDQTLIAATDRGLYLSTNAGKIWNAVGPSVTALSVAIGQDAAGFAEGGTRLVAFAGTILGLYVSTDGGRTWDPTALGDVPVVAIALSPEFVRDRTILVGTLRGAYLSTDGGASWGEAWLEGKSVHSVLFSPDYADDRTLFLGASDGVYVSRDGGETWAVNPQISGAVYALVASPSYARQPFIYAGTERSGVMMSMDQGRTWVARNNGIASLSFDAVAVSPAFSTDRTVFAGGASGVWRSTDDGLSWQATSLNFAEIRALVCSPGYATDGKVYAATNSGLFVSSDRGESWRGVSAGLDVLDVTDLALGSGGELWIATAGGGIYYSANDGASWVRRSSGLQSPYITAIEWLGSEEGKTYLLAGTWGSGVFVSSNGGLSWVAAEISPDTPFIHDLVGVAGYAGQKVSFAGTTAGIFRSVDRGNTWEFTGLLGRDIRRIVPHPDYTHRPNLYVGTGLDGVFRSTNGGLTWSSLNEGLANRYIRDLALGTTATDVVVFATTTGGVWRYGSMPESPRYILRFPLVFKLTRRG